MAIQLSVAIRELLKKELWYRYTPCKRIAQPLKIKIMGKVLAVDDDPFFLEVLVSLLKTKGYDVVTATTVPGALSLITPDCGFRMVLTDFHLGDQFGSAVVDAVKEGLPGVVVLMISGSLAVRFGSKLAEGFLQKPIRSDELFQAIDKAFANKATLVEH